MSIINSQKAKSQPQLQNNSKSSTYSKKQTQAQPQNKEFFSCIQEQTNTRIRFHKINHEIEQSVETFYNQSSKTINQKKIQAKQKIFKNKIKNVDKKMMLISYGLLMNSEIIQKDTPKRKQDMLTLNKTHKITKSKRQTSKSKKNNMEVIFEEQSKTDNMIDEDLQFEVMKIKIQNINKKVKQYYLHKRFKKIQKKQNTIRPKKPIKRKIINEKFETVLQADTNFPGVQFKVWLTETYPRFAKILTRSSLQNKVKLEKTKNIIDDSKIKQEKYQLERNQKKDNMPIIFNQVSVNFTDQNEKPLIKLQDSFPTLENGEVKLQDLLHFQIEDQSYEQISIPICCKNNQHDHQDDIMKFFDQSN